MSKAATWSSNITGPMVGSIELRRCTPDLIQRSVAVIVAGGIGSALGAKRRVRRFHWRVSFSQAMIRSNSALQQASIGRAARPPGRLGSPPSYSRNSLNRARAVPGAATIGVLVDPNSPEVAPQLQEIEAASHAVGQKSQSSMPALNPTSRKPLRSSPREEPAR